MAQAARKLAAKDTDEKLAHRRLMVRELAERLRATSLRRLPEGRDRPDQLLRLTVRLGSLYARQNKDHDNRIERNGAGTLARIIHERSGRAGGTLRDQGVSWTV